MQQKTIRALAALLTISLTLMWAALPAFADEGNLGTISHYNGIIFGSFNGEQADCEGALAIWGDAIFGSEGHGFDMGAAVERSDYDGLMMGTYKNPYNYPTLLLGGAPSGRVGRIYNGDAVLKSSVQTTYENDTSGFSFDIYPYSYQLRYVADAQVDTFFADAYNSITTLGKTLMAGNNSAITTAQLKNLNTLDLDQFANTGIETQGKNILVINVTDTGPITVGEIQFPGDILDYDTVVLNFEASDITFTGGAIYVGGIMVETSAPRGSNTLIPKVTDRLIWNFPNADTISVTGYGVVGTILAPDAELFGQGGSINGMLTAGSLEQDGGFELHAFTISGGNDIWDWEPTDEPDPDPDPDLGAVILYKVDAETGAAIRGAAFKLQIRDGDDYTDTGRTGATDGEGSLSFDQLAPGDYRLVEMGAADGYDRDSIAFNPDDTFTITDKAETVTLRATNAKETGTDPDPDPDLGSVILYKADAETGAAIRGAAFKLQIRDGDDYTDTGRSGATDGEGSLSFDQLAPGDYRLVEMGAADGYDRDSIAFNPDDTFTITDKAETITLRATNAKETGTDPGPDPDLGAVILYKADAETGAAIRGAAFKLQIRDGDDYTDTGRTGATDGEGSLSFDQLAPGDYRLVEMGAAAGYDRDSIAFNPDDTFTITDKAETIALRATNAKTDDRDPGDPDPGDPGESGGGNGGGGKPPPSNPDPLPEPEPNPEPDPDLPPPGVEPEPPIIKEPDKEIPETGAVATHAGLLAPLSLGLSTVVLHLKKRR